MAVPDASDVRIWLQDCPDPTLLPLIATCAPPESVYYVAMLASITGGSGGPMPFPTVAEETAKGLAARFADIDIQQVREEEQANNNRFRKYPKNMRRLFRVPHLPRKIMKAASM